MINGKNTELLAPAGSYKTFEAVLNAGADAVYVGGGRFGARAYAENFSEEELLLAIDYAHLHGKKLYLTVNTLLKEQELEDALYPYLLPYYKQGLDAVIVQDMGVFAWIKEAFPQLPIHASTQMTITGAYGASWLKVLGASRIVASRELSLAEIRAIHDNVPIEIEAFVHGALCYCYSGQCLLSSMIGGRSGNRGRCAQPCRLPYEVCDCRRKKVGQVGNYILSPKDLCAIALIPDFIESGVCSFKIEGRMKQTEYAAGVVAVYRRYIDRYMEDTCRFGREEAKARYHVEKADRQKLYSLGNRSGFTDGYLRGRNGADMITFEKPNHVKSDEVSDIYSELKERIKGILRLKKGFSAMMEVSGRDCHVVSTGQTVEQAVNQPLSREKIEISMTKTGNTPFEFEELAIDMDEDIFLPIGALNHLRRDALSQLFGKMTEKYRRSTGNQGSPAKPERFFRETEDDSFHFAVSVEQRRQLTPVLAYAFIENVYLDSGCYTRENWWTGLQADVGRIVQSGKGAYLILPPIFRKDTAEFYRENADRLRELPLGGLVIKNYDEIGFVKNELKNDVPVILDHSLYTYNNCAKAALWKETRAIFDTAPLELNKKELFGRDNRRTELLIYGYLPLMISAQCVRANTAGCDKCPQVMYLKDRYGKYFPVKNTCAECYNTIYNTTPLQLFGMLGDFPKMGISHGRIAFTVETEQEIHTVLGGMNGDIFGEYTNGHYKRGVE